MSRAAQILGPKNRLKLHSVRPALGKLGAVACHDTNAILCTLIKTKDINKHLPCLEAPLVCLGIGAFSFCPPRFSVNRSLDKKSLERLSPWLACHYH